ncbi:MAG: hypothetical protein HFG65_05975 [Hungatella sp.]|nr:hypothetical protein [Hungatella sp.]
MTDEQKRARKKSAESGNISWIKKNCLRTKDDEDDYVFISYKSDDYKEVLDDIVYQVCQKYGLRVYFDTAFDEDSKSWIEQYYDNMISTRCKAMIAFIDDAYYSSYATLLEMMSRKTAAAGGDYEFDSLFFLPINLGAIHDIIKDDNTGLGTERFSNGRINTNAELELRKFNEIFSEIADVDQFLRKSLYKREHDKELYKEKTNNQPAYGKKYLTITQCRKIMGRVIPRSNDNDGTNKDFVEVIHDKLVNAGIKSVFQYPDGRLEAEPDSKPDIKPDSESDVKPDGKDNRTGTKDDKGGTEKPVPPAKTGTGTISLKDFLKKYDNNTFKKSTYTKFRLAGAAGYEKYGTEYFNSAFDLAWAFVMGLIEERGQAYIDSVNARHPGLKNPVFLSQEEYENHSDQKKYKQVDAKNVSTCYMYRHYGQYQWIDGVLKPRLVEFGLPMSEFYFQYVVGSEETGSGEETNSGNETACTDAYGEDIGASGTGQADTDGGTTSTAGDPDIIADPDITEDPVITDGSDGPDIIEAPDGSDQYVYTLWGEPRQAYKLSELMHDVFDVIAGRYPGMVNAMADDGSITAVARKEDVDEKRLPINKINYFKTKKEHTVQGCPYYVSTRYNRDQGIGQLKKMLTKCEGNDRAFVIKAMPGIKPHGGNSQAGGLGGKKGIGEFL